MSQPFRLPDRLQQRRRSNAYRSLKDGDLANPVTLGEFLEGVGGLMQLPPKPDEEPPKPLRLRRTTRFLLPTIAMGFAVVLALGTRFKQRSDELPAGLTGRWATIATNYSDRALEFLPDRVVFQTGPNKADRTEHMITAIQTRQVGDTTLIILSYLEAGSSYDLDLKFASVPELGVRFTNQDWLVWRPAGKVSR